MYVRAVPTKGTVETLGRRRTGTAKTRMKLKVRNTMATNSGKGVSPERTLFRETRLIDGGRRGYFGAIVNRKTLRELLHDALGTKAYVRTLLIRRDRIFVDVFSRLAYRSAQ